jgi:hypothetical protein
MLQLKKFLSNRQIQYPAWKIAEQRTYWKKGYAISPPEGHRQIVAIKGNSDIKFTDKRGINRDVMRLPENVILHHFSWARTDAEVLNKINHFSHNPEFNIQDWYNNLWLKWSPSMTNLHPVNPGQYQKAIPIEVPSELKHIMESL